MTQLAEKQKQSIDSLSNDQIDLAKFKSLERHAAEPLFTYEEDTTAEDGNAVTGIARVKRREDDTTFEAAYFCVTKDGQMYWSVNPSEVDGGEVHPNAVSLVIAREDGTVEQLGVDEAEGEIEDFAAKDVLYVLPNAVCEIARNRGQLTKEGLDQFAREQRDGIEIVRVSLDGAVSSAPAGHASEKNDNTSVTTHVNTPGALRRKSLKEDKEKKRALKNASATSPQGTTTTTVTPPSATAATATGSVAPVNNHGSTKQVSTNAPPETSRVYGFTESQTAILDTMKARRTGSNGTVAAQASSFTTEAQNVASLHQNQEAETVDPAIEHARKYLDTLRQDMAALAAKRQGRFFNFNRKAHAELEEKYNQQRAKLGKLECSALLSDDTKTDSEKNVGVIGFLFDEQQRLREATIEGLKNTPVSKMINWLHEGTKTQRLLKGAAIGAGSVLIGAGIGATLGVAAGAGLAAAAVVTTKSVLRFGRYYAREENKQGRGMNLLDETQQKDARLHAIQAVEQGDNNDKFNVAGNHFNELFEADTRREQEKRRISARRAIGGVALGMIVGGTIAYAVGEIADGKVGDWANRNMGGQHVDAKPSDIPTGGSSPDLQGHDMPHDTTEPPVGPPPAPAGHEFSMSAKTIDMGEGWLQTFNEAGITDIHQQYALLNNEALMQTLADKGLAYRDANIGGWGINMTADGKMPADALQLIETYANRNGYALAS